LTEEKQLIRPIWAEIDYYLQFTDLPYLLEGRNSSIGKAATLEHLEANQIDSPSQQGEERFYLHYFPPFW
jgi:polyribonucleotide nucleotidyltransferase